MNKRSSLIFLSVISIFFLFSAEIKAFQINLSQNEKQSDLYKVKLISSVEFEGNKNISTKELLDVFNFNDDIAGIVNSLFVYPYHKGTDGYLKFKLIDFLRSRGHLKAEVGELKLTEDGEFIKLVIPIEEGALYRVGKINIKGAKVFTIKEVEEFLDFKQGQVLDPDELQERINDKLPKFFGNKGFINCNVEIETVNEHFSKVTGDIFVNFNLIINEGKIYRVKQINIFGDADKKQVFSFFSLKEGEIFNQARLDESIKNINESDLFEKVDSAQVEIKAIEDQIKKDYVNAISRSGIPYKIRIPDDGETQSQEKAKALAINITVNKSKPKKNYYLGTVKFIGNKTISEAELKKAFNLQENSYLDFRNLTENIRAFNKTGKCKPIIEDDFDIEIGSEGSEDDESSEHVNLTIRIHELRKF